MAICFDVDGDGAPAYSGNSWHYFYYDDSIPGGFRSQLNAATGCPESGCIGYELSNDIDLDQLNVAWKHSGYYRNLSRPLESYGDDLSGAWNAVFEGNGYTISGVNLQQSGQTGIGLFGEIASDGVIRNLGLNAPRVRGDQSVGALAGINRGTIQNVYVMDGAVVADTSHAELITGENRGTIRSFWATGSVTAPAAAGSVAGGNYGGSLVNGWSNGFAEAAIPLGDPVGFGLTYLSSYSDADASVVAAREVDAMAGSVDNSLKGYLATDGDLRWATASSGFSSVWDASVWDFGDNCQRPVLKSGDHSVSGQTEVRGNAALLRNSRGLTLRLRNAPPDIVPGAHLCSKIDEE